MDKRVDNTDLPFVPDENLVGLWDSVDFIENIDQFTPGRVIWPNEFFLKQMQFLDTGEVLSSIAMGGLRPTTSTWTKDFILNKADETCSAYVIKEIEGSAYLFMEWKSGDYSYRGLDPCYYALKKSS